MDQIGAGGDLTTFDWVRSKKHWVGAQTFSEAQSRTTAPRQLRLSGHLGRIWGETQDVLKRLYLSTGLMRPPFPCRGEGGRGRGGENLGPPLHWNLKWCNSDELIWSHLQIIRFLMCFCTLTISGTDADWNLRFLHSSLGRCKQRSVVKNVKNIMDVWLLSISMTRCDVDTFLHVSPAQDARV